MKLGSRVSAISTRSQAWTVIEDLLLVRVFQRLGRVKSRHSCSGHPEWQNHPYPLHRITHTDTVDTHH